MPNGTNSVGGSASAHSPLQNAVTFARQGGRKIAGNTVKFFAGIQGKAAKGLKQAGSNLRALRSRIKQHGSPRAKVAVFSEAEKAAHKVELENSPLYKALTAEIGKKGSILSRGLEQIEEVAESLLATPAAVRAMQEHGVTLSQAVAISLYTSQAFLKVNGELRSDNPSPAAATLAEAFNAGLKALPSFKGGIVYRGVRLPEEVGKDYQVENVVRDRGILSTSWDKSEAFKDANFSIQIVTKEDSQLKDIAMFSDKPEEREVAGPTGLAFLVTGRERDIPSHLIITPGMEAELHKKHPGIAEVVHVTFKEL